MFYVQFVHIRPTLLSRKQCSNSIQIHPPIPHPIHFPHSQLGYVVEENHRQSTYQRECVLSTSVRKQSLSLYHLSFHSLSVLQTRTKYGTANRRALKLLMCRKKAAELKRSRVSSIRKSIVPNCSPAKMLCIAVSPYDLVAICKLLFPL